MNSEEIYPRLIIATMAYLCYFPIMTACFTAMTGRNFASYY